MRKFIPAPPAFIKSQWPAIGLIIVAYLGERPYIFFRYPGVSEGTSWLRIVVLVLFILFFWLLCLLVYIYAAKSSAKIKWSIFLLLAFSSIAFDAHYVVSGGWPLFYEDFAVMRDAIGSTGDALSEYYPVLAYSALRLAVLFCGFLLMRQQKGAGLKATSLFIASVLAFGGICVLKRGDDYTKRLPGTTGLYGFALASIFDSSPRKYVYSGAPSPSRQVDDINIVLVIDESVRADFLSSSDLKEIFSGYSGDWHYYNFGAATSSGNCSASSNIMLRKGVRPDSITSDLYDNPLIWSYGTNAGFATYLLDAQFGGKGHDHFDPFELGMLTKNIDASQDHPDFKILNLMDYLQLPGKTFSIIVMQGSHFPYSKNFPEDHSITVSSDYVAATQNRIDYAKSVDWQTKNFIKKLISSRFKKPTIVVYTSDHGQNLNDVPGLIKHCSTTVIPFAGEGLVPFVVFTNYQDDRMDAALDTNYGKLSHFNIFPTILEYMGFDIDSLKDSANVYPSPITRKVRPLSKFSYGDPFGRFGKEVKFMYVNNGTKELVLKRKEVESLVAHTNMPARGPAVKN